MHLILRIYPYSRFPRTLNILAKAYFLQFHIVIVNCLNVRTFSYIPTVTLCFEIKHNQFGYTSMIT